MKTDLFLSSGYCWVFCICWHIKCSTITASSFRIWNSSTRFPSPPLALFVVMLPKAHLIWHSKMSGCRLVITSSWLSGSWRSFFVQFFCVLLTPLLNSLSLIQQISWPRNWTGLSCIAGRFFTNWAVREAQSHHKWLKYSHSKHLWGFPGGSDIKESARFDLWIGKVPWRRKWLPTPVFLPGEFHG